MNSFEKEIKDRMSQRVANIANNFSKGENDFLTQEDFEGLKKINEVYTPDDILNYRADLQKAFDDEEIEEKDYVKGIEEIARLKIVKVENGLNMPKTFFFKSLVEDLEKAEPEEDDEDDDDYDDMEKAIGGKGEGSRGGKIIGHTKSGKPIYSTYNNSHHERSTSKVHDETISRKVDKKEEGKFEKLVDELEGGDSDISDEKFLKVMKKYLGKNYNHDDYMTTGRGGSTAKNLIAALKEKGADLYYVMSDLYSKGKLGSDYHPKQIPLSKKKDREGIKSKSSNPLSDKRLKDRDDENISRKDMVDSLMWDGESGDNFSKKEIKEVKERIKDIPNSKLQKLYDEVANDLSEGGSDYKGENGWGYKHLLDKIDKIKR